MRWNVRRRRPGGVLAAEDRAVVVRYSIAIVVAANVLLSCTTSPSTSPPATPGTTGAITRVGDDFLELAGDDIFGDVAAGGGSVWVATLEGLIQVDPATMEATWHTDLAPGKKIVYAFDSLWVGGPRGLVRVDPTSLEETATVRIPAPEGVTADADSLWTGQHDAQVVLRIDPRTHRVVERIDVADKDNPLGSPMGPSVVDGDVWLALGNVPAVVRIDARDQVTRIAVEDEVLTPPVATSESIWFSNWQDLRVTRVNRENGSVSSEVLPESALAQPGGAGPGIPLNDRLWFPTSGGTMLAIDPVTFDVVGTLALQGSTPRNAIVYGDAVWLVSEFDGSLERITLERLDAALLAEE